MYTKKTPCRAFYASYCRCWKTSLYFWKLCRCILDFFLFLLVFKQWTFIKADQTGAGLYTQHQSTEKDLHQRGGKNLLEEKPETYNGQIRAAIFGSPLFFISAEKNPTSPKDKRQHWKQNNSLQILKLGKVWQTNKILKKHLQHFCTGEQRRFRGVGISPTSELCVHCTDRFLACALPKSTDKSLMQSQEKWKPIKRKKAFME